MSTIKCVTWFNSGHTVLHREMKCHYDMYTWNCFSNLTQFGEIGPYDRLINDRADKSKTC